MAGEGTPLPTPALSMGTFPPPVRVELQQVPQTTWHVMDLPYFIAFFLQVTKNKDKTYYLMSGSSSAPIRPCPGSLCPQAGRKSFG